MRACALGRTFAVSVLMIASTAAILLPDDAQAQRADESYFRITPYIWALSLDGTTSTPTGGDVPVDASFSDLLDDLNLALMVDLEWNTKSGWYFLLDALYAELETEFGTPGPIPATGSVDIEMVLYDGLVGYAFNDTIGMYAGVRFYDQDITLKTDGGLLPDVGLGADWTDYILGIRVFGELSEKWSMGGRFDGAVGGDSDSAFNLQFIFARHFGESMHLNLGWRYYDVDYETGTVGLDRFKWDVSHSGPVIGWSWEF